MWADTIEIFRALMTQDSFEIRTALRSDAAWVVGAAFLLVAGPIVGFPPVGM